eukprot:TRINITY_DN5877_c0_g1_i5.p2 TRINITY_DN5877_c0_g1~~TRINITY_DN5877_c0_g1_i5.p2  ORF type:complete len:217 (+),score=33.65 TRINITY_DN5877_c0_g1_i5:1051-1701(+)
MVNGKLVIDQSSLEVEAAPEEDLSSYTRVRGEDQLLNQFTYMSRDSGQRWTKQEDEKFFELLGHVGANFELIRAAFPTRSYRQIKRKYHQEWKKRPQRINYALSLQGKQRNDQEYQRLVDVLLERRGETLQLQAPVPEQTEILQGDVQNSSQQGIQQKQQQQQQDNDDDDDQFDLGSDGEDEQCVQEGQQQQQQQEDDDQFDLGSDGDDQFIMDWG